MTRSLAVDLGGTHIRFRLLGDDVSPAPPVHVVEADTVTSFEHAVERWRERVGVREALDAIGVAAAGPVKDGTVRITNLDWTLDSRAIERTCNTRRCLLVNDVTAIAWALPSLGQGSLRTLAAGGSSGRATMAVIAPGTGLGVSGLVRRPRRTLPRSRGKADIARWPRRVPGSGQSSLRSRNGSGTRRPSVRCPGRASRRFGGQSPRAAALVSNATRPRRKSLTTRSRVSIRLPRRRSRRSRASSGPSQATLRSPWAPRRRVRRRRNRAGLGRALRRPAIPRQVPREGTLSDLSERDPGSCRDPSLSGPRRRRTPAGAPNHRRTLNEAWQCRSPVRIETLDSVSISSSTRMRYLCETDL